MAVLLCLLLQAEDPRAKAVREAYEEQLRRESPKRALPVINEQLFVPDGLARLSTGDAITFLKLWAAGEAAYAAIVADIEWGDLETAQSAVHQLNALTGRRSPLPDVASRARVHAEWKAWLRDEPCGHSDVDVRRHVRALADDALDARIGAERALEPCARRHRTLIEEALREEKDVEASARLRSLIVPVLGKAERAKLSGAHGLIVMGDMSKAVATLRAARFPAPHARTLDLLIAALER